jgi:hypothetical protein
MIEIFQKLTIFNDYKFYEDEHYYTYKGQKVSLSATRLIEEYSQPFDEEKWAPISAKREGVPVEEILKRWKINNLISQIKGTNLHKYMEDSLANKYFHYSSDEIKKIFGYDVLNPFQSDSSIWDKVVNMMDEFLESLKGRLIPIRSELVVGDPEYDIAGMIDQLFWNEKTQQLEIWDWKTNKDIKLENKYQKMQGFLNNYDDCNFIHYSLQLNIYKHILQKMTGLTIGACRIVWFNENNDKFQVITCKDMYKEAVQMLEERKVIQ